MTNDFQVETTYSGTPLNRDIVERLEVKFEKGLSAVDPVTKKRHSFEEYGDIIFPRIVAAGESSDGSKPDSWDDRKLRFTGADIHEGELTIYLGMTYYQAFSNDINDRTREELRGLQEKGIREFNDIYAFHSRAPGAAVLLRTSDNVTYVAVRENRDECGKLTVPAGHLEFRNPQEVDLLEDITREAGELGKHDLTNLIFCGAWSQPLKGDLDFGYIAQTAHSSEYFDSGAWLKDVHGEEKGEMNHKIIKIATMRQAEELLDTGRIMNVYEPESPAVLMPATRGLLMSLRPGELRD